MSKMYVKDEQTGKYKIVDKPQQTGTKTLHELVKIQYKIPAMKEENPEAQAWIREIMEGPKLKELDARVKVLEKMLLGDRI